MKVSKYETYLSNFFLEERSHGDVRVAKLSDKFLAVRAFPCSWATHNEDDLWVSH